MAQFSIQAIKQRFGIIGNSKDLERALETAVRVADTDLTVLITGESGTGKEIFSQIIHSLSKRKHNKFIAVNCGAIPPGTINSELFGHEKGSFTGATGERKGYFETADGGTIFLDEIAEMPLDTQSYLLRILESGEFIRVGSSKTQRTNVRVIAATNVNLLDRIESNRFREDLYYRLNIVPIHVPALKQRRDDIYLLFRKFAVDFAEKYSTTPVELDEDAKDLLYMYHWPGNVRELKNFAEQLSVLSESRLIDKDRLILLMPNLNPHQLSLVPGKLSESKLDERELLYKVLFDMKKDVNELKNLFFELIRRNKLEMPEVSGSLQETTWPEDNSPWSDNKYAPIAGRTPYQSEPGSKEIHKPILLDKKESAELQAKTIIVEEPLSLEQMEKDLIGRALTKHKGRRKEASGELGISERTLYRKIKQYDLE
ncbi:MAG: sigma-54-dependent Fis family transcriptional regulator [Saprospiraceae bacterium]|nr:sigma-54-dependent Fis family transcriptional regulator [Saprospiraceae bacterium]MBK6816511.1 sigma-54-dependent Fis family transcriptional regulator [Saprospiraceae bacterium]MBK8281106.1 sigma-54-dependent Fis family transcriptional regulator [Saprospiraceae bacterium]MBK8514592.1 sigma-54-dependent Fis family transcriptional regulator [Saprospiraceae bacterium]MBK9928999.1 sigma-54-dependent Fis family transcriptional regulator [Saprospiraceae bacterium]